jgi:hypothetical protein
MLGWKLKKPIFCSMTLKARISKTSAPHCGISSDGAEWISMDIHGHQLDVVVVYESNCGSRE